MRMLIPCLLAACAALGGCGGKLDEREVREFVDAADTAARKRFAPEICELRGENFRLDTEFHADRARAPTRMSIDRRVFCLEAGKIARLYQYQRERKSLDVRLAPDRKTAIVTARYEETMPFYGDGMPRTPDDFYEFQVLDVRDESKVGVEHGDIVYLSTDAEIHQKLVPKTSLHIPYE